TRSPARRWRCRCGASSWACRPRRPRTAAACRTRPRSISSSPTPRARRTTAPHRDAPGSGGARAPALVIALARGAREWRRRHFHADLELAVRLDGGLAGTAVLLAPHERQLVTDLDLRVDDPE